MKTLVMTAYKGGSGKSTLARGIATTLAFWRTQDGLPLVPVVILADILGQSPAAKALIAQIFPEEKASARYMKGRGFYVALRSRAPAFVKGAIASGKVRPEQLVLIADTGAQLVLDAARSYASASAFLIPYMRSDISDGVPKLLDTLTHLQFPAGLDAAPDRSILDRTHIVLNALDPDPEARARQLEKSDYRAILSNTAVASRVLRHGVVSMRSIADNADLTAPPNPHGLKHTARAFAPMVAELAEKADWTDIVPHIPTSGAETRILLQNDARDVIA
jgi:hypothetical protein